MILVLDGRAENQYISAAFHENPLEVVCVQIDKKTLPAVAVLEGNDE